MDDAQLIKVLKALAHPQRFRMVQEIAAAGELSCGQVGETCPTSQPTTSHHMKILSDVGLLRVRQDGKHRFLSVDRELLERVGALLPLRIASAPARKPAAPPRRQRAR